MARKKDVDINIQAPIGPQRDIILSEKRFSVCRWGRRTGKTRLMFIAASLGKGPGTLESDALWPGFLSGGKVCWISIDNPQMENVWSNEILKRFEKPELSSVIHINKELKIVSFKPNGGKLYLRSMERPHSVRGYDFDLIISDEAAYYPVMDIWRQVFRPTLVDRKGGAIICSTTKTGSQFNELCEAIQAGEMGATWEESYATAYDNPKMDPDEIDEMVREYPTDSVELDQEVWAKLVVAGGLAFPEWDQKIHVYNMEPPDHWPSAGVLDWGYSSPGWFGHAFFGGDGEIYFRWEFYFNGNITDKMDPWSVGQYLGEQFIRRNHLPQFVLCDSAMWQQTEGSVTVAEKLQNGMREACGPHCPALVPTVKGPGSRATRKMLMHDALRWTPGEGDDRYNVPSFHRPRLTLHADCNHAIRTIPTLARDQKDQDKVETVAVEDHCFDGISYILSYRTPHAARPYGSHDVRPGRHPGLNKHGRRRPRWVDAMMDEEPMTTRFTGRFQA